MDKFEYNVRSNEIKELIKEGNYKKAADIADTIDWRRVRSIMMLCTISDVYKINRRYEDSRDILLYAYERHPNGRLILYYLCELSIKLGDIVSALEYYKSFVQAAPRDASQFILLYKIYEAQDATLEERIIVLEELKRRDYKEKWAFELAYLYHLTGQTSLCIDECNEIFSWFGRGKYVTKALELKQLHTPLPEEQASRLYESQQGNISYEPDNVDGVDYYNESEEKEDDTAGWERISNFDKVFAESGMNESEEDVDVDIRIRPVDVSEYNTINLQQEIAENMKELLSAGDTEDMKFIPLKSFTAPLKDINQFKLENESSEEVYFEDTGDVIDQDGQYNEVDEDLPTVELLEEDTFYIENEEEVDEVVVEEITEIDIDSDEEDEEEDGVFDYEQLELKIKEGMKKGITETGVIKAFAKPSTYDDMLSQGYDGQISLVVPDEKKVEKQITGQLKIDDILTEWERQKREIEQKRKDEVRMKIQEQTATLFNDFDTQTKMGLLEKLEKAMVDASVKAGPSVIKVSDIGAGIKAQVNPKALDKEPVDEEVRRILESSDEFEDDDFTDEEDGYEELAIEDVELVEAEVDEEVITEASDEVDVNEDEVSTEEMLVGKETEINSEDDVIADEEGIVNEVLIENKEDVLAEVVTELDDSGTTEIKESETAIEIEATMETGAPIESGTSPETEASTEAEVPTKAEASTETEASTKTETPTEAEAPLPLPTPVPPVNDDVRIFTPEEKIRFGRFVKHKKTRRQLVSILDQIKEVDNPSHVVVTGEESLANMKVIKGIIKEVKTKNEELFGKVVKISGDTLNKKTVPKTFANMASGIIIIEHAASMKKESVADLMKFINTPDNKLMVILEDNRPSIDELLENESELKKVFPHRIDLNALDNQSLVEYAKNYAFQQEYSIDEFGILALHTRIAEMQTSDHEVTTAEVEELIEEAIYSADRKNPKHFFDILAGKRYDEEDMIILREKDFLN